MSRPIVKIKDKYCEWTTIWDAPATPMMSLDYFTAHYRCRYGTDGMRDFADRMERVERNGTSLHDGCSAEDLISGNRAGDGEKELTMHEIYDRYQGGSGGDI
jgi:hypothetical protein